MFEQDLALNNLPGWICHKTHPSKLSNYGLNSALFFYKDGFGIK